MPLSDRALAIVEKVRRDHPDDYLFPGAKRGKPLSNMAMLELMRGMTRADRKPWTDRDGRVPFQLSGLGGRANDLPV